MCTTKHIRPNLLKMILLYKYIKHKVIIYGRLINVINKIII